MSENTKKDPRFTAYLRIAEGTGMIKSNVEWMQEHMDWIKKDCRPMVQMCLARIEEGEKMVWKAATNMAEGDMF